MFHYYLSAGVCYAFLFDVPGGTDPNADDGPFHTGGWPTRGWTLQDLLRAPQTLLFIASDWTRIGSKLELADTVD